MACLCARCVLIALWHGTLVTAEKGSNPVQRIERILMCASHCLQDESHEQSGGANLATLDIWQHQDIGCRKQILRWLCSSLLPQVACRMYMREPDHCIS